MLWCLPTALACRPPRTSLSSWNPAGFYPLPSVPWFSSSAYKALLHVSLPSSLLITLQSVTKSHFLGQLLTTCQAASSHPQTAPYFVFSHTLPFSLAACTPLAVSVMSCLSLRGLRPPRYGTGCLGHSCRSST